MKRTKKVKSTNQRDETVLIDGYYVPKEIAKAYAQLRCYCVSELTQVLEEFCHSVHTVVENDVSVLSAVDTDTGKIYKFELSPMKVSQIEKAIGTKKLQEYIKEQKNG